jgi:hypothetical protein
MQQRPYLLSGVLGLGAVVMTLVLSAIGPRPNAPLPAGYVTPVLAFEFAETEADVVALFAPIGQPEGDAVRAAMDRVNRLDFLYMALYGGCLAAFALTSARLTGRRIYMAAAALALAIVVADALENVQLLAITRDLGTADVGPALARLRLFTWLKWGGLALWFLLMRPAFARAGRLGSFIGLVAVLPLLLGVAAFLWPGLLSELFALSIGLLFLLLTIFAWRYRPAPADAPLPARPAEAG